MNLTKDLASRLSLKEKEALFYVELLTYGPQTVKTLSMKTGEQRTNCYLILESLIEQSLVERDESKPVARFRAAHPSNLRRLAIAKQKEATDHVRDLATVLPDLTSLYRLTTEKEGISYFTGPQAYEAVLEDMAHVDEVLVFISKTIFLKQPKIYDLLQQKLSQRGKNKVRSRFLTCADSKPFVHTVHFNHSNMEVRATPADLFDGEIAIYNNKVVLTTYEVNTLTTLVITDPAQAQTFKSIFEMIWKWAE